MNKIIFIGGGVGPLAGVEFHKKIINNTLTDGTDQDHIEIYHFSRSHDIADRTKYLLGEVKENPAEGMFRTLQILNKGILTHNNQIVMGIPCNTFHAPIIFNHFLKLLYENKINIRVLNMIEETGNFIKFNFPHINKIGIMSTTGTRLTQVYNNILLPMKYEILEIPNKMQVELHESIHNKKWGIKAKSPVTKLARNNFLKYSLFLINQGVEIIILGCTEIPLALTESSINNIPLIDPMNILSKALIRETANNKLVQ